MSTHSVADVPSQSSAEPSPLVSIIDSSDADRRLLLDLFRECGFDVDAYSTVSSFSQILEPDRVRCVLISLRSPGSTDLAALDEIQLAITDPTVIVLTPYGDVPTAVAAMKRGAFDFLEMPINARTVVDRVKAAISTDREHRVLAAKRRQVEGGLGRLSHREREVLELLLQGMLNKQVAVTLDLSEKTIAAHRARILSKMQTESLTQLVRNLLESGIPVETISAA
ncbi:MAG: LuxR C-terminal-related transcriptional regulator [Planctomycetota bacterium]